MNYRPENATEIANETSAAAVLICEILHAHGKTSGEIKVEAASKLNANTDYLCDRNGDGKHDARYSVWFDKAGGAVRAIDIDNDNDGKRDSRMEVNYEGGSPASFGIDIDLDAQADVIVPIHQTLDGRIDKFVLDFCQRKYGVSGRISIERGIYNSLQNFCLDLKSPSRYFKRVQVQSDENSRPKFFKFSIS